MEMVRYCPECDDEFRPEITVCSDCGSPLLLQGEGLGAGGVQSTSKAGADPDAWRTALDSLPLSSLVPVRTFDSLKDLEPAVGALGDIELPSRILVQNGRYILLTRPENVSDAHAALHEALVDKDDAADPAFDEVSGRYSSCPACGARLAADPAPSCPECGLELVAPGGTVSVPEGE